MPKIFPVHFGFKTPVIIQAPMAGGITTPRLVAAVANAYGLGSYATGYLTREQVETDLRTIKSLTTRPFAANLFIPPAKVSSDLAKIQAYHQAMNQYKKSLGMQVDEEFDLNALIKPDHFNEIVATLLAHKVPIVSFTFGNLSAEMITAFKENGTYLIGTATSLEEAQFLASSNIDAVIAQGIEAGGHRGGFFPQQKNESTMSLVKQIVEQIDIPVIAAGAIMDGRGITAALAIGAAAVQLGTAFLTTKESGASDTYKKALLKCRGFDKDPTRLTTAFSGKLARGIENQVMQEINEDVTPEYPIPHWFSTTMRREAALQGKPQFMSLWCGQGVPQIRDELPAADLIAQLRDEVEMSLKSS